jgi:cytoskeleton protein RodZ
MSSTLGQLLRATREAQGHTLEDVEAVTRIRARHLAALENDDYAALPSPAQARGFLKNYAQHLDLDLQEVLAAYEAAQKKRGGRPAPRPKPAPDAAPARRPPPRAPAAARPAAQPSGEIRVRRPRVLSADLLVAGVITVLLAALLVWGGAQVAPALFATGTATRGVLVTGGTAAAQVTPSPAPPTPTPAPPTPAQSFSGVNVTVLAEQRVWVSVQVDGQELYAGLMPPGEAREFVGQSVIEVTTGNGLGTRVTWNGVDQGLMGDLGEVVTRLWTLQGMVIPTPTATPEA